MLERLLEKIILFFMKISVFILGPIASLFILENVEAILTTTARIVLLLLIYIFIFTNFKNEIASTFLLKFIFTLSFLFFWWRIYIFAERQKEENVKNKFQKMKRVD